MLPICKWESFITDAHKKAGIADADSIDTFLS